MRTAAHVRIAVVLWCISAASVAIADQVRLRASWVQGDDGWRLRIQPETLAGDLLARPLISPASPALRDKRMIQLVDPLSGEALDFQISTIPSGRKFRFVELSFPEEQRPRELALTISGLILEDAFGERLLYNRRATAGPTAQQQQDPPVRRKMKKKNGDPPEEPAGGSGPMATPPRPFTGIRGPASEPNEFPAEGSEEEPPVVRSAPPASGIPKFPFPPPRASAFEVIPRRLIAGDERSVRLSDVEQSLGAAFDACGYGERSYYAVPQGFAMASSIEQLNADGSPSRNRWSLEVEPLRQFSLRDYARALFTARPGYYRVIVFMVTDVPFQQTNTRVSSADAGAWVRGGVNTLPREIGRREFTDEHDCTALIYEFKKLADAEAQLVPPTRIPARLHLQKSGFWAALEQRR